MDGTILNKEILKKEIDNVPDNYFDLLFQIIKLFEKQSQNQTFHIHDNNHEIKLSKDKLIWDLFIEKTSGCLSDSPIMRPDQGNYESREYLS